jgi:hypothetical protein
MATLRLLARRARPHRNIAMNRNKICIAALAGLAALGTATSAFAYVAPNLRSTASYLVLSTEANGLGAVTCTDSTIDGKVGSTGARPAVVETRCSISGSIIAPVPRGVATDFKLAYDEMAHNRCQTILTGTQAGAVLAPGVYCFDASAVVTGTLTLNGNPRGVWIFLVNGDLTGNDFSVVMAGGGKACNVYWAPSGATTMTTSNAKGNFLSLQAVTLTGGSFEGRAFAGKAATLTNTAAIGCGGFVGG